MTDISGVADDLRDNGTTLSGGAPASVAARIAWTIFEFGGGPYFVVVQIFVFAAYFANGVIVGNPVEGQAYWGYIGGAAGFLVALCSPITGAIADRYGPRKPGVLIFTIIAVPLMSALWWATPGHAWFAAICTILATLSFELAFVFSNAMLPSIAPANRIGILSASGYAMSYLGAMLAFGLWFALPLVGFHGGAENGFAQERASGLLAGAIALLSLLPLMILTPDVPRTGLTVRDCVGRGLGSLGQTLRDVGQYRNVVIFMIGRMIYYDGLTAVFAFVGIYAAGIFGWREEVAYYGLLIIITAALSAVGGGLVDDKVGSKRTILVSLVFFSFFLALNLGMGPRQIAYIFTLSDEEAHRQIPLIGSALAAMGFRLLPEQLFVLVGIGSGLFVGPALSSSRTFMARLAPREKVAEFFGLYNLTGRATAFMAPTAIGLMTQAANDQRAGLFAVFVFIAVGFILLCCVKEPAAGASPPST